MDNTMRSIKVCSIEHLKKIINLKIGSYQEFEIKTSNIYIKIGKSIITNEYFIDNKLTGESLNGKPESILRGCKYIYDSIIKGIFYYHPDMFLDISSVENKYDSYDEDIFKI